MDGAGAGDAAAEVRRASPFEFALFQVGFKLGALEYRFVLETCRALHWDARFIVAGPPALQVGMPPRQSRHTARQLGLRLTRQRYPCDGDEPRDDRNKTSHDTPPTKTNVSVSSTARKPCPLRTVRN